MRRLLPIGLLLLLSVAPSARAQSYRLVWSDEFNGSSLDLTKWEHQTGTGCPSLCGWGNNELQYYRSQNTTVAGGFLTITAKAESFGGQSFTSSRLRTRFRGDWTYGRIEMRAKLPAGQGLWPAFWMLPTDEVYGGWAASGEIDLMEARGAQPTQVVGTIHYGATFPGNLFSSSTYTLPSGSFTTSFHDFAFEWEPCEMRWYVDGVLYATKRDWSTSSVAYPAPFDQRFHLLLNLAVGGNFGGNPNGTTVFPQQFTVDYVRVYQYQDVSACTKLFDGMDHNAPFSNGWFVFNGSVGGGGINGTTTDVPPGGVGCKAAIAAGYGSGGNPGFQGGFGRTKPMDLTGLTHFTFWVKPDASQSYRLEINLQDDDNGDNAIPGTPDGQDDEFQYNLIVSPAGPGAVAGGGWQRISIPLSAFTDDNTFHFGGNGVLDPRPTSAGGNGQLVNVVIAVVSTNGSNATFRTDRWAFTRQASSLAGRVFNDADADGVRDAGENGIGGVTVQLYDPQIAQVIASQVTPASGDYVFGSLAASTYEVRVLPATLPGGTVATNDPDGLATADRFTQDLACDSLSTARDFGYAVAALDAGGARPRVGLAQNSPNPFRPRTVIAFELARTGLATLTVLDVAGRPVRTLLQGETAAGPHRVEWDGRDEQGRALAEGIYFYTLATADGRWMKRMTLLR